MPCIIISPTHLFVSLGIHRSRERYFLQLLNEALAKQQSRLLTAFAHERKPDEGDSQLVGHQILEEKNTAVYLL